MRNSDMVYDIEYGYPLALTTTDYYSSAYHLPGHQTDYNYYKNYGPIGHWLDNHRLVGSWRHKLPTLVAAAVSCSFPS